MQSNIAIIPARLGSKRIKQKNIKIFHSKPIIQWTYEVLKKSKIFSRIILCTESEKIIKECKKFGFNDYLKRNKKLSKDNIGTNQVVEYAIKEISKNLNFQNVCCVYPCNPFLKINILKSALKTLKLNKKSFVQTIVKFDHPVERSFIIKKNNELDFLNKKVFFKNTQYFKTHYYDAGQFYFAAKNTWLSKSNIKRIGIEIPKWNTVDIDTNEDWKFAKLLFKLNYKK